MDAETDSYRYAIKNAYLHEGKADMSAVVGKIKALDKNADLKKLMPVISEAVKKVNAMGFAEIENEYRRFEGGYELRQPEKKEGLPDVGLENIVTRFAPNPNGPFHLGNARAAILSDEYAKNGGKFLLRFDDTDPKVKKPITNAKEIFMEDLNWLECSVTQVYFASDRLGIYYSLMEKIIELGGAYVCTCDTEKWKKLTVEKNACPCRDKSPQEHLKLFGEMVSHKLKEGKAVLRIKTDLNHPDPSVRDWWAAKIVDKPEHPNPNAKDRHVWPSYNFASAIDDHELGTTLIIRGQEHKQNKTKQEFLYTYFGWVYPKAFHFGRVKLEGMVLSTSKIKAGIEAGIYTGWDDINLGTIRALRRRGFAPKTLRDIILEIGVKPSDTTIEFAKLADLNRKNLVGKFSSIEFIEDPVVLEVGFCPAITLEDGTMLSEGTQRFIVPKKETEKAKIGSTVRLKHAYNVKINGKNEFGAVAEFVGTQKIDVPIMAWLLETRDLEAIMPQKQKAFGVIDAGLKLKEGEVVYLERFGYARIDEVGEKRAVAWFTHK
ncbi:MAG: glutamate--tRNA ligase [Candidatus Diapherotrites archaeon]|nr:glutamate--tRNA ligase [Candidatus Diapherotrites archaeon]